MTSLFFMCIVETVKTEHAGVESLAFPRQGGDTGKTSLPECPSCMIAGLLKLKIE